MRGQDLRGPREIAALERGDDLPVLSARALEVRETPLMAAVDQLGPRALDAQQLEQALVAAAFGQPRVERAVELVLPRTLVTP